MALIWVNGALHDRDSARLSVLDHGLTVGDGVFETLKVQDGRAFALTRHLDRLAVSARGLGLEAPDLGLVRHACEAVLEANPVAHGRLRLTCTAGRSPLSSERGGEELSLVVAVDPCGPAAPSTAAITVPWVRNERGALTGLKTTSYAENVVALARAHRSEASEAVFANTAGQLCEGTGTNVFVAVDGELHTPPLAAGPLAGITRALVLEWVGAHETDLPFDVLERADEIFLTSSLRDVQAVHRLDGRDLPDAPGPLTAKAQRVFAERSAADIDP
ncbi:aminotransferase class IV [Streptomyces tardus]|uniref:aminotransferase class IV n=1 Tax=Streptomyces tardus TaxID=2780544 RepID=UPI0027E43C34|nr:aminodeoxychorismate lyase [Streptomyces tardus]